MLTITETASTAVKTIVDRNQASAEGGLRIAGEQGASELSVTIAPAPEQTDAVVERDGARVFLGDGAIVTLDDKVLDAEIAEDGTVRFSLANQA